MYSSIGSADLQNLLLANNYIYGGGYGIRLNSIPASTGVTILNNELEDQGWMTLWLNNFSAPVVRNNQLFQSDSTLPNGIYGINFSLVADDFVVEGNRISGKYSNSAIRLSSCNGTLQQPGLVANNVLALQDATPFMQSNGITCEDSRYIHFLQHREPSRCG